MEHDSHRNVFPIFDQILGRKDKENMLEQKGRVIWLTGLSGSGKSTIARSIEGNLNQQGFLTQVVDGDNVRTGICNNLGFSAEDRMENIRRVAEVSKMLMECGIVTINSFVSPTNDTRDLARSIIGADDFIEVYINAPLAVCEERDVKGLYKKARQGEIKDFTGIDAPFEAPDQPSLELRTDELNEEECVAKLMAHVIPMIKTDNG